MAKNSGVAEPVTKQVPVEFGGVSIGDQTARVGVTFDRSSLSYETAIEMFVGKRLDVKVIVLQDGEDATQKTFEQGIRHEISGSVDVKRLSLSPKKYSCGLTFMLESIDKEQLFAFAKKSGLLQVSDVEDLPDDGGDADED